MVVLHHLQLNVDLDKGWCNQNADQSPCVEIPWNWRISRRSNRHLLPLGTRRLKFTSKQDLQWQEVPD